MKRYITAILCLAVLFGCKSKQATDTETEVPQIVKAYTSGIVSDGVPVRIEFNTGIEGAAAGVPASEKLFSFSPALKGNAVWASDNAIEFHADKFKAGTTYKASFDIKEATGFESKKFEFNFYTSPKEAYIIDLGAQIREFDIDSASVNARVIFSENINQEQAEQMISFSVKGKDIPVTVKAESGNSYLVTSTPVKMEEKDQLAKVTVYGKEFGYTDKFTTDCIIPNINDFKVISAKFVSGADQYAEVIFTKPLSSSEDYTGLIEAKNAGRYYLNIEDNKVKVFTERLDDNETEIIISPYLKSSTGNYLGETFRKTYVSKGIKPAVELPFKGNILPDAASLRLPFRSVNLSAVDLSIIKIYSGNVMSFLQENRLGGSSRLRTAGRKIYKKTIRLDSSKDLHQWQDFSIDLSKLIKKEKGAIYRIRLSFRQEYSLYGKEFAVNTGASTMTNTSAGELSEEEIAAWDIPQPYYYESAYDWRNYNWKDSDNPETPSYYMEDYRFKEVNLLYSNIGLIAKYADDKDLWLTVTDLMSAQPMSGADIRIYNYQLQEIGKATSDKEGQAKIRLTGKPFIVMAKTAEAVSYLKVSDGAENSLSRFDTGGEKVKGGIKGFAYGERGVWRPGDTLHLSLIIDDKNHKIPANHPVKLDFFTPAGQFYTSQMNSKPVGGIYCFDVTTKEDDPTGTWNAYFKVGGSTFHKAVNIETIKPNRLKIDFRLASQVVQAGKADKLTINSSWLTGAAASDLEVKVDMGLKKSNAPFKGYESYTFTNPCSEFSYTEMNIVSARLGKNGTLSTMVNMPAAKNAPGMLTANFTTRVSEPGGDESFITVSQPYSPFKSYVGLQLPKESDDALETDKDYKFNVAVLDGKGHSVTGDEIEYAVYKLKWSWWWESSAESLDSYVNGTAADAVAKGRFTASQSNSFTFKVEYPDWGRYLVYVKDVTSGHATGSVIYVDYPAWRGRADRTDPDGLTMLSFSLDKKKYEVGEKATVYVPAAAGGRALVSLENSAGVISRTWVATEDGKETPYSFEVTKDMAPNFYVHITLLQPHGNTANDLPIRMYGVQPVMVYNPKTILEPVITMDEVLRPQTEFSVKVSEKNGRAMAYTLAIVDEGLLDITGFKTPDPWNRIYAREALGVKTWDLFDDVVGAFSGRFSPLYSIGGDEDMLKSNKKDNRFNPVVKFLGTFKTGAKGSKTHKITLPMYVGSVRVMVVAADEGAYGCADKSVPVRSPLMILPTAPRVLGTDEQVAIPVNVFAMEEGVRDVNVRIEVTGAAKVASKAVQSLNFSEISDKLATFTVNTAKEEGSAKITITATGGGYNATETINLEVRNPEPMVRETKALTLGAGQSADFEYQPFAAKNGASASLTLAGFPAIDVDKCFDFAYSYEHNCSEQLSSRGLILLSINDMANDEQKAKIKTVIPEIIRSLCSRQLADGGFAYWSGSTISNEWVSSMAGHFLKEAAMAGYAVNPSVLRSWENFQKRCINNYRRNPDNFSDFVQAYRLFSLAVYGKPDNGAMNRLKEESGLSDQARWCLAAAYCLAGKKATAQQMLNGPHPEAKDSQELMFYTYGSALRDKAMYLETLVLMGNLSDAILLAQELSTEFSYSYMSTQTTAFAANAMSRLAKAIGNATVNAIVTENGKSETVKSAKAYCTHAIEPSNGKVSVRNEAASGIMTAVLNTRRQPLAGESKAASAGLSLSVTYTDANGSLLNPSVIIQGTDIFAKIVVTNTGVENCNNLALTIGAPSGWELFNERLTGGEMKYANTDIRDDKAIFYFSLAPGASTTVEQRFHASYCGTFTLPAIRCEDMYKPAVYARTASTTANVLSR